VLRVPMSCGEAHSGFRALRLLPPYNSSFIFDRPRDAPYVQMQLALERAPRVDTLALARLLAFAILFKCMCFRSLSFVSSLSFLTIIVIL